MLSNFSFLKGHHLAGCGHPGRGVALSNTLGELTRAHRIRAIVSLSEDELPKTILDEFSLHYHHLPIQDFGVPTQEKMDEAVTFALRELADNRPVVVHCGSGYGRTGTFLACCLVALEKIDAQTAIRKVRHNRPGSIETIEQEDFVRQWAQRHQNESPSSNP